MLARVVTGGLPCLACLPVLTATHYHHTIKTWISCAVLRQERLTSLTTLVPLGGGLHAQAVVPDTSRIYVHVALGFHPGGAAAAAPPLRRKGGRVWV